MALIFAEKCSDLNEFEAGIFPEAKISHAPDRMEAVIQHNEADISTWTPIEYDMNAR